MSEAALLDLLANIGLRDHGENPHDRFPASSPAYEPSHLAIVHLRSNGPWSLNIIHAHYECKGSTPDSRIKMVDDVLQWKTSSGSWSFNHPKAPHQPCKNKAGQPAEYLNFRPFEFGSPHDIYFFFEHGADTIQFDGGMLIKITDGQGGGRPLAENESFYGAADVTGSFQNLGGKGTVILMENHFTKGKGKAKKLIDSSAGYLQYKLNLVYGINPLASDPSDMIKMIIDPDTGNGSGTDP